MPRNPKKKKKARDRAEIEDGAGADDARQEIADKIQERKVAKAKSKSSFTRRKNSVVGFVRRCDRSESSCRFEIPENCWMRHKNVLLRSVIVGRIVFESKRS